MGAVVKLLHKLVMW